MTLVALSHVLGSSRRFRLIRQLGEGGMGAVYEADDRERGTRVAVKTLLRADARALQRLKNEFRSLQDLQHPNLVRLEELHEEHGQWFISMELVSGTDFLHYVRRDDDDVRRFAVGPDATPRYDEGKLRAALQQLAIGLRALHAAGKVHRDIKPSNIRVTPEGRVVILDFGLVVDRTTARMSTEGHVVGTAAYMAPEQASGTAIDAAADWYAFGVVIYEALTGTVPFEGSGLQMLMDKVRLVPDPPHLSVPQVPLDLDALCTELLQFEPRQRPRGDAILKRLGAVAQQPVSQSLSLQDDGIPFLGRDLEMAQLHEAFQATVEGRPITLTVQGPSGTGKSALIQHFVEHLKATRSEVIVLHARCYERETARFKAVDGIVDALATELAHLPRDTRHELVPRNASLLRQLFPVLGRVDAISRAPCPSLRPKDPVEERRWMFASLRELIIKLVERRTLVLVIDDMQWTDGDSLALLRAVLDSRQEAAPPLLLITSAREPWVNAPLHGEVTEPWPSEVRTVKLDNLSNADALTLARLLLERAPDAEVDVERLVSESAGHPLFVSELVRYATQIRSSVRPLTLDDAIWERACALPAEAMLIMQTLAVASLPLAPHLLDEATSLTPTEIDRHLGLLRIQGMVRSASNRSTRKLEPSHDRVREAVLERMDPGDRRELHQRLAPLLEKEPGEDPELIAQHYLACGEKSKAAALLARAAAHAEQGLAFERAALLCRLWSSLLPSDDPEQRVLQRRIGESFARVGHATAASEAFSAAIIGAPPTEALEIRTRRATCLLRGGYIVEGLDALDEVLESVDERAPKSELGAVMSFIGQRVLLRWNGYTTRLRDTSEATPVDVCRADALFAASQGLAVVDGVRSAPVATRALRAALRLGDPERILGTLVAEIGMLAHTGNPHRRAVYRAQEALQSYAVGAGMTKRVQAALKLAEALIAITQGRFADVYTLSKDAASVLADPSLDRYWEHAYARLFLTFSQNYLGKYKEGLQETSLAVAQSEARQDRWQASMFRMMQAGCGPIARGDAATAAAMIEAAYVPWRARRPGFIHLVWLLQRFNVSLCSGDWASGLHLMEQERAALRAAQSLRPHNMRAVLHFQLGKLELQRFAETGCADALSKASRHGSMIRKQNLGGFSDGYGTLIQAQVAHGRGDLTQAKTLTDEALVHLSSVQMEGLVASGKYYRGTLIGGEEGAMLRRESQQYFEREEVVPSAALLINAPYAVKPPR